MMASSDESMMARRRSDSCSAKWPMGESQFEGAGAITAAEESVLWEKSNDGAPSRCGKNRRKSKPGSEIFLNRAVCRPTADGSDAVENEIVVQPREFTAEGRR